MENQTVRSRASGSDSTVDRIIDAAEQLFAETGYDGTALRQIANLVGIREPSIYAHFANKEAVYGAVIDRALEPFHSEIGSWIQTELTLRDLFEIPRKILELHARHPYAARILHREFCSPFERISPKIVNWLEQITAQSSVLLSGLPNSGGQQLDRRQVVIQIITITNMTLGFFSSQGMQMKLLGEGYDAGALFEAHVQIVSRILRGLVL